MFRSSTGCRPEGETYGPSYGPPPLSNNFSTKRGSKNWGASRSRQRQAELRARGAELQRELITRELYLQFASARQEAVTAAERVDNARLAVADAERNVTISISRYRAGEAPITEVTDALTTQATQRLTLQQALFDYQVARVRLQEAVGQ